VNVPSAGGHAALMDRVYRRQRHLYDATRRFFLFGRDRLVGTLDAGTGESIVEIGCGTARNLIGIARRYPGTRLYGLDASQAMLLSAREAVKRAGLESRITLAHGYAEDLTPAMFGRAEPFDRAIFSYSLSMIPGWPGALEAAAGALTPSGAVHIVDFGDFSRLWRVAAAALLSWLGLFHVAPRNVLLNQLERMASERRIAALILLPGRYAFIAKLRREEAIGLLPSSVAGWPHTPN